MSTADKQSFRDAMAHVGAAVNIITTDGPAGRAGFTASAVCSVTDAPPTLLVCLNRSASVWPIFSQHQPCALIPWRPVRKDSRTFFGGKTPMAERFAAADWQTGATGCPRLGSGAGQLRLPYQPDRQRRNSRHPVLRSGGDCTPSGTARTDVVRPRLPHADASSLLTLNPGSHHGSLRFSSLAVNLPLRRVRRRGPR
ncbi:flavin reductase RutF in pyrimidine catabolism pathway [Klebsiella michiganensis]|nr:flavin reductase RutF in pyrimidine catabolism pathway [Klebsiella michiganensis]